MHLSRNQAVALDNPKDAAGVTLTEQADLTSATTAGASLAAVSTAVNDQYAAGLFLFVDWSLPVLPSSGTVEL